MVRLIIILVIEAVHIGTFGLYVYPKHNVSIHYCNTLRALPSVQLLVSQTLSINPATENTYQINLFQITHSSNTINPSSTLNLTQRFPNPEPIISQAASYQTQKETHWINQEVSNCEDTLTSTLSSFFSFKTLNSAKPAGVSKRANILVATALLLSFLFNPPLSLTQRTSSQWGNFAERT